VLRWHLESEYDSTGLAELGLRQGAISRAVDALGWVAVASVGAACAVVAGVATRTQSAFQSDDVAQIVALRSWAHSGLTTYYSGSNTYGLRFPIVALVDAFETPGKHELYVLTGVLMAGAAVFLALAVRLRAKVGLGAISGAVAVAWVVSNPGVVDGIARPTVRNIELGIAAFGLVWLDRLGDRPPRLRWVVLPVAAVALGMFLWNDPYFEFIVVVPAIGFALLAALLSRSLWRLAVAGMLAAGVVVARLLDAAGSLIGVDALQVPFTYPKPDERQRAKDLLFKQLPNAIGTKSDGTSLTEQQAFANRLVIGILVVCAVLALVWCVRRWRDLPVGTITAAFMLVLPGVAWYASSNMFTDDRSWRYMMMTPFVLPILLVPAALALPHAIRPSFLGLAALVMGYSLWCNVTPAKDLADCGLAETCVPMITLDQERQDLAYAAWLENSGVKKVLVPYWHSNTTTYLSDGHVPAVTFVCDHHRLLTWRWLTTDGRIEEPVTMSHLVLEGGHAAGCTQDEVRAQLGPPVAITKFSDYQLWAYQGDIAARLPTRLG
jgi:hypothetical protein